MLTTRIVLILVILLPAMLAHAQPETPKIKSLGEDVKGIVYNREFATDFKIHTQGMGLGVNFGRLITYYKTRYLNFSLSEIKHPREYRQSFDFRIPAAGRVSRSFIYGKQNQLFTLHGGFGEKRYFSEKALNRGLAVGISYSAGPALGLLKPYYLDLIRYQEPDFSNFFVRSESYSEDNADKFLDINSIYGASGILKGLNEIKIVPGGHAKFAVHLDWGAFDEFVKAVEAGVMVDLFFRSMPLMVAPIPGSNTDNQMLFVNFFVNLQLGKRR
jgi:hypothetical protein